MIRDFNFSDLKKVNELLKEFDYSIDKNSFSNEFLKIILYENNVIEGVLVYNLIYDRIEIDYIVVHENYRNKGIATSLLKYIEKDRNIKNITLEVRESNINAIKFYLKNGFKKVSIRKNYYKEENGILMMKSLVK